MEYDFTNFSTAVPCGNELPCPATPLDTIFKPKTVKTLHYL